MYDGIIIGGGPAGMFAAIRAAEQGNKVLLIEKNDRLGKKLLITGKGRCNVTNDCTAREVLENIPLKEFKGFRLSIQSLKRQQNTLEIYPDIEDAKLQ